MLLDDEQQTQLRNLKRLRRLGDNPACMFCGETRLEMLRRVKRSSLEAHHVFGEDNDPEATVIVCANCHGPATEKQLQCEVDLWRHPKKSLERLVNVLRGFASFFLMAVETLLDWAERVTNLMNALDAHYPEWRNLPEAKYLPTMSRSRYVRLRRKS